jgi:hypothetical protein
LKPGQHETQGLGERQRRQVPFGPEIVRDLLNALYLEARLVRQTLQQIARRRQLRPAQRLGSFQPVAERSGQLLAMLLSLGGHRSQHSGSLRRSQVDHRADLSDSQISLFGQLLQQFA